MKLHIVHLPRRKDRKKVLLNELKEQGITQYRIWNGIEDPKNVFKGLVKAHKQVVEYAKLEKLSSILIVQDDIRFTAKGAFEYFLNNVPADFDLYLSSIYYGQINQDKTVNDFAGLTLFMVHERFYDTFLSLPEDGHLDRALANKGKYIVCEPFVAIQHNGYSDNRKAYCNYDVYVKNMTLFA